MTQPKRVRVKIKKWSILVMALFVPVNLLVLYILNGMTYDAWDFGKDFIIFIGMFFLLLEIFPLYVSEEGLECNFLLIKPIFVHWGEVDFDTIKQNKFTPLTWVRFSWCPYQTVFFPGHFYIQNREEVFSLIEQYTKKYR